MVDNPRELVQYVSRLLAAELRARGTRKKTRALTCFRQALFGLVWFRKREDLTDAAAARGRPTLADAGYQGAGIGIHTPFKQPTDGQHLGVDNTYNMLLRSMRCIGKRGFALLIGRWRVLRRVTASPSRIGHLANAALVLTQFEHRYLPC